MSRPLTIVLSGGGTGGHITPILAVARELKLAEPHARIVYIGERKGKFQDLVRDNPDIDEIRTVFAGKFRRYHGYSWLKRLLDVNTNVLNIRDVFFLVIGTLQALVLMKRLKPAVTLLKGGFVGVPVGLAAAFWHQPLVTHDSDALPGLANRLVARWTRYHATGMPPEFYQYKKSSIRYVGVLVEHSYQAVDAAQQREFKAQLDLPTDVPMLLITGGSSGAERINQALVTSVDQLLKDVPSLRVIHQVGRGKAGVYRGYTHARLRILEFLRPMHVYTGAADLVITRASGNTLAELGVQGKACIVIPSPFLAGGHQLRNAEYLEQSHSAVVLQENALDDPDHGLLVITRRLLHDDSTRAKLAAALQAQTPTGAAQKLAVVLLEVATDAK